MHVVICHQHEPGIHNVGGVGTFIRTFIKYAPPDFRVSLVGVSSDTVIPPYDTKSTREIVRYSFLAR